MDKKSIKNFAMRARKVLIEKIKEKALKIGVRETTIEEVSYQCFSWLTILRYMEIKEYLSEDLQVFSNMDQYKNKDDFKDKIIDTCSKLNEMLPFIFNPISDNFKNLFPDLIGNVLLEELLDFEIISKEDWKEVEIVGWLYQYFMWEKHKEVVRINNSRIQKEQIAPATQLFTPKWIVKYMVQNTLGKYWIEHMHDEKLESKLAFYIKGKGLPHEKIDPKDIKVLDPACGAGHILVYAFEVLYYIYLHVGYEDTDIPKLILKHNLYGLEIDEKACQLAVFALMMKAREKDEKFFCKMKQEKIIPNICCIEESNILMDQKDELLEKISKGNIGYDKNQIDSLFNTFYHGKEYGAIIKIKDFDEAFWEGRLKSLKDEALKKVLKKLVRQAKIMSQSYEMVIANPPYLSNKMMSAQLKKYVDAHFKDYNGDLFSVFMKRSMDYVKMDGYLAFMTPFVWMFIKRYEKLREIVVDHKDIVSLIELQYSSFEEATVPICTFVLRNNSNRGVGDFIKLSSFKGAPNQPIKALEAIKDKNAPYRYRCATKNFRKIPGISIAYWAKPSMVNVFQKSIPLKKIADARVGLQTSNNKKFVRFWHEVDISNIGFDLKDRKSAKDSGFKWFPYNKGGDFRKWYGNHFYVVNWENDGEAIRTYNRVLNASRNSNIGIANTSYYFKKGITWSFVSSAKFGVRISEEGFIFDTAGSSLFPKEEYILFIIALLCSKITYMYLMMINPTLNFQPGNIGSIPVIFPKKQSIKEKIDDLAKECIDIAKMDWDENEISWSFKKHPLLQHKKGASTLKEVFENWKVFKEKQFEKMKKNEEKLNKIFIELYGLEDQITPDVDAREITVKKADGKKGIRAFIAYGVGCIFGRYSLDQEGIVFAGGKFNDSVYKSFHPVKDNILPIEGAASITSKFVEFLKVTFGEDTLNENLDFITRGLGRRKESSITYMKKYFQNEFYKDHVKMYQRRPIYFLFTSGKHKAFQGLLYIHRFNEDSISNIRKNYIEKLLEKYMKKRSLLKKQLHEEGKNRNLRRNLIRVEKELEELINYHKALMEIENNGLKMNLDNGVKMNYQKLKEVLSKI
ncbi:BREX-1 system adenine-specific DNA-methyltransferase PglX [Crassaminicella profunda]|uniref:BREX-1 system adenine-specific DNA-methyltransferase PglX n=1 Tax=Crassaminicella profunda TaxID=1286698 RepID=UPI001CA66C0B|nr:BREX-1 system adenine-specific DNA-methyltransferase PglX [Crassaminicella profunda]QZY54378.1 BREX-1 system adenine-specific DNA-methyltransferase PglX [Crassaminicella profunda]